MAYQSTLTQLLDLFTIQVGLQWIISNEQCVENPFRSESGAFSSTTVTSLALALTAVFALTLTHWFDFGVLLQS